MPSTSPQSLRKVKPGQFPAVRFGTVPTLKPKTIEPNAIIESGDHIAEPVPARPEGSAAQRRADRYN
jgi:hypothetical protein